MHSFSKKTLITVISAALLFLVGTGSTLAYLFTGTASLENTFTPVQVSCAVVENEQVYTANTVNVSSKGNVYIKNTSDVSAYIRAAVVVTWKSTNGNIYALNPVAGTDYTCEVSSSNWTPGSDGFYYYSSAVDADALTTELITSAAQLKAGPDGYYLSVEILAEAIQAEGMGATTAQVAWQNAEN